jgi:hypothetical protein
MYLAYALPIVAVLAPPYYGKVRYRPVEHFYQLFGSPDGYRLFFAAAIALPLGVIAVMRRKDIYAVVALLFAILASIPGWQEILHQLNRR